jgi:hypothetical protein
MQDLPDFRDTSMNDFSDKPNFTITVTQYFCFNTI